MSFSRDAAILSQKIPSVVTTIDSHTEGEITRLIVDGPGPIPGATMTAKRVFFKTRHDRIRQLVTREPRGSREVLAALVTDHVTPGADFGLIYMDARRYPYLCGHATIGAVKTLADIGCLQLADGKNQVRVDTPSGPVDALVRVKEGRVETVAIHMVPSFVHAVDQAVEVPGFGRVMVDLVCTGGFFAMVDAARHGIDLGLANKVHLIDLGMKIITAANEQVRVAHPTRPEVKTVDVTEFWASDHSGPKPWGRGVVVYGERHMDRSPCGTGTAAKLTLLRHYGRLGMGQGYRNLSPLDTSFDAELVEKTWIGSQKAYVTRIKGRAWITGIHHFFLDKTDPFQGGYLV